MASQSKVSNVKALGVETILDFPTFSGIEKEVIILKAVVELINEMVNYEMLTLSGGDSDAQIMFKTTTHRKFFNIILLDFLSYTDSNIIGEKKSYLDAIELLCEKPNFNQSNSVEGLATTTKGFKNWLDCEIKMEKVWFPSIDIETTLLVKRSEFIRICGNISKHNFSRLSGVVKQLSEILKRNDVKTDSEDTLMILGEFYDQFSGTLIYHASTIAEFLNNLRWGIQQYLQPEFSQSIQWEGGNPPKYKFLVPENIQAKLPTNCYWDLMNDVRAKPCMPRFKVTKLLKMRY